VRLARGERVSLPLLAERDDGGEEVLPGFGEPILEDAGADLGLAEGSLGWLVAAGQIGYLAGLAVAGLFAVVVETTVAYVAAASPPEERGRNIGAVTTTWAYSTAGWTAASLLGASYAALGLLIAVATRGTAARNSRKAAIHPAGAAEFAAPASSYP